MEQILMDSFDRMRQAGHIEGLLGKAQLEVSIVLEEMNWLVKIHGSDIRVERVLESPETADVLIKGEKDDLQSLFRGEDFLISMKKREALTVEGDLKDLLLLESLWYLSKNTVS
ncbi:SCP2 sterol-binding domain-containing protein [Evansella tamaricis]|uniref:SCP2 sterol-binding domain-containing protein n=1 Tax=Evansella tamaricis TaxID=2069301 RepID=A0ABS6JH70_9BACI|nr:SCP2 sterol-binding domain-containing protein [Evansella tamaricis]MBU9712977.1 SCP2 sterol-binding domain-containing protein [Evansella tamaricis]